MSTKFGTSIVKGDDSFKVGQEAAKEAIKKIGNTEVNLSIVFCSSEYDYQQVVNGVRKATDNAPLIGCSTAGEFTEEKVEKGSVACAVISSDKYKFNVGNPGKGLRKDEIEAITQAYKSLDSSNNQYPYGSAVMLIDGLAGKGEEAVWAAVSVMGPNINYSGGAAGDDLKFKETVVFANDEIATDAVSLCMINSKIPLAIGVKHGHSPISPPLIVTKSKENIVYEINEKPAFEVWKEYTREPAKKIGIDVDNINSEEQVHYFLTRYEAGLLTGGEYKIRWPGGTSSTDGPIHFPCSIPEGTVLRVMESPQEAQILSAKESAKRALDACRGVKIAGAIVFDCVCRAVILGDEFSSAVDGIKEVLGNIPMIGFETYGEIAMEIGQLSGLHNTTTVVLLIPE